MRRVLRGAIAVFAVVGASAMNGSTSTCIRGERAQLGVRLGLKAAWADDVDTADLLAKVAAARSKLHTAKATFTQERTIGLLSSKVRSRGEVTLVMPDQLRWELFAPDEAVYWVGPDGISYKSANGQGMVPTGEKRVAASMGDLRALLGGDLGKLGERYVLHASDNAAHDEVTLDATAKDTSHGGLRGFSITWAKADLASPLRASLLEGGKDRSDIVFGSVQKDVPVDAARMRAG